MSRLDQLGAAMVVGFVFGTWVCGTLVPWLRDRRARRRYTGSTCRVLTELPPRFEAQLQRDTERIAKAAGVYPHNLDPSPSPRRQAS